MSVSQIHAMSSDVQAERPADGAVEPKGALPFILSGAGETRVGIGVAARVAPVPADASVDAARALLASHPEASLIVGALPFDRAADVHLYAPREVLNDWRPRSAARDALRARDNRPDGDWSSIAEPSPARYAEAVKQALALLEHRADLHKVVLARSLLATAPTAIDTGAVLARLAGDPSVTAYAVPLPASEGAPSRTLIGASPELLVDKRGLAVRSTPLAGSARRSRDKSDDEAAATALLNSQKDRREHAFVVEAILDTLAPWCGALSAPSGPSLVSTASMWHLGTAIEGTLKDADISVIALAAALHPTPAVCGLPRDAAKAAIAALEGFDRGFYAGAVGWANREGDGRWMVAIRCAELSGRTARLYAGAGIVPGSDPWSEVAETSAKFTALLSALGIDETGSDRQAVHI